MSRVPYDPSVEGAKMDFSHALSYSEYLGLDQVLSAQFPRSTAHDELLFIIQHQTSELWMKLALHELDEARELIRADSLQLAFKMLTRVARIFEQLNSAWDVLRTMTPGEYTQFRESLGPSSGFQSYQYRLIEFLAGNKNEAMLRAHEHDKIKHDHLSRVLHEPSLYDEVLRLLQRRGFLIDDGSLKRDFSLAYQTSDTVIAAWAKVYKNPSAHWDLYELAEKLVDFEDYFRRWRFNHVTTVERVIGFKRGTGGTGGVSYLRRMLEVVLFPELWQVRTVL